MNKKSLTYSRNKKNNVITLLSRKFSKYDLILRHITFWDRKIICLVKKRYRSVPNTRQFNTSVQHVSSTQGLLFFSRQFHTSVPVPHKCVSSTQVCQFPTNASVPHNWRISVELTHFLGLKRVVLVWSTREKTISETTNN